MADMQIRLIKRLAPGSAGEFFNLHASKKLSDGNDYEWANGYINEPTPQQVKDFRKIAKRAFARAEKRIAANG